MGVDLRLSIRLWLVADYVAKSLDVTVVTVNTLAFSDHSISFRWDII